MFKISLDTDKKLTLLIILFLVEWFIDKLVMLGMFFLFRWIEIVRKIFWSGGEEAVGWCELLPITEYLFYQQV